jgi:hypothetical protein
MPNAERRRLLDYIVGEGCLPKREFPQRLWPLGNNGAYSSYDGDDSCATPVGGLQHYLPRRRHAKVCIHGRRTKVHRVVADPHWFSAERIEASKVLQQGFTTLCKFVFASRQLGKDMAVAMSLQKG